jgi:mannose-6-phosphate isomerase-like protein (cupin superfamily)
MRVVWMPGGVRTSIELTGDETDGRFCLLVDEPPHGWSLPPHRHLRESETIHVVAGRFEFEVDGTTVSAGPGETVHVPTGVVHSGRCLEGPGHRVLVFSPAGIEAFFLETGAESGDDPVDLAAALDSATRHGWQFTGAA